MVMKSVMHAPPTAEEIREFKAIDTENRIAEEALEQEISAAKGEQTQSQIDPLAGCDPRDGRVLNGERDARLRHKDFDQLIETFIVPAVHRMPHLFTVLRDTVDAGEVAYQLARLIQNPNLAARPEFRDFQEYLQGVADRPSGRFDNLSVEDFEKVLDAYKEHADEGEAIGDFFDNKVK